jgi:hypothetical protein
MMRNAGSATLRDLYRESRSIYASGWNILFGRPIAIAPRFEDQKGVMDYIFSWLPSQVTVYPSEGFYYFVADLADTVVSGNVRIADLDNGEMSFAYFTIGQEPRRTISGKLQVAKGDITVKKESDLLYQVTYQGKTVTFDVWDSTAKDLLRPELLSDEQVIGRVQDESGVRFFLLYNTTTTSFYYLLDESGPGSKELLPVTTQSANSLNTPLLFDTRTDFVYYADAAYNRKILVGVHLVHIAANNFFDGPGDQVPYRANLRDMLYVSYPNTRLDQGVNEHGVIQGKDYWVRVAITPYMRYTKPAEIDKFVRQCQIFYPEKSEIRYLWSCMTKEFWNNPGYREFIAGKLAQEGKDISNVILHQLPRQVRGEQLAYNSSGYPMSSSITKTDLEQLAKARAEWNRLSATH